MGENSVGAFALTVPVNTRWCLVLLRERRPLKGFNSADCLCNLEWSSTILKVTVRIQTAEFEGYVEEQGTVLAPAQG